MINVAKEWNPKQALLKEIIKKQDRFDEAIDLILQMHSLVHSSKVSGIDTLTFEDELWNGMSEDVFRKRPKPDSMTMKLMSSVKK